MKLKTISIAILLTAMILFWGSISTYTLSSASGLGIGIPTYFEIDYSSTEVSYKFINIIITSSLLSILLFSAGYLWAKSKK